MRDAMGGVVNLVIIVVFMVIISGYLAFNVSYTRAFRVKNKIISTYEQYNGNCESNSSPCMTQIMKYMQEIGYDMNQHIDVSGYNCRKGFCSKRVDAETDSAHLTVDDRPRCYYKIVTQVTIDLPIINRVMQGMDTFRVKGDTKSFIVE